MASENLNKKFIFTGFNPHTGQVVTQDNAFVFKASDDAVIETLEFYHEACKRRGCDEPQLKGIKLLIERIIKWRADNPDKCKPADTSPEEAKHTN